jgi:hypothetical protein
MLANTPKQAFLSTSIYVRSMLGVFAKIAKLLILTLSNLFFNKIARKNFQNRKKSSKLWLKLYPFAFKACTSPT